MAASQGSPPVVLVTGCSFGGIGFYLCEKFAAQGCKVYATGRSVEKVKGFKQEGISVLALDVTSQESVEAAVKHIIDAEGQIDILVNNAGGLCSGPLLDIPIDRVKETFDTNTFSILRVAKAVIPHMAARKQGTVINIGSIVGNIPTPWAGIYCATKAALHSLTEVLYMECKPFNVNVILLVPGGVRSNIANTAAEGYKLPEDSLYKSYLDKILRRLNMSQAPGAMSTDEFADVVVRKALSRPPPRYLTLGKNSFRFAVLQWFPRTWVLHRMWKIFG